MIISISPPASISRVSIEKKTKSFFRSNCSIGKSKYGLLATGNTFMVLVQKRQILLSFSSDDVNTVSYLQDYLSCLFKDAYIGVDINNPITDKLSFVMNLPRGMIS